MEAISWKKWFDAHEKIANEEYLFGGNCFMSNAEAKKYFKFLEKDGAKVLMEPDLKYNDSVIVIMPQNKEQREKILLFIITTCPAPTNAVYNKKKDILLLEWS